MKKKEYILYSILCLFIILSIIFPYCFMNQKEKIIFDSVYYYKESENKLSLKASNYPIIKNVYARYYGGEYYISTNDTYIKTNKIIGIDNSLLEIHSYNHLKKLEELFERNILDEQLLTDLRENRILIFREKNYKQDKNNYFTGMILYESNNDFKVAKLGIEIDIETKKIIYLSIKADYITNLDTFLNDYLKYLELTDFTDWVEEGNMIESKDAGVKVAYERDADNILRLYLLPIPGK